MRTNAKRNVYVEGTDASEWGKDDKGVNKT